MGDPVGESAPKKAQAGEEPSQVDQLRRERDENQGKLLRALADYQNLLKRLERERSSWATQEARRILAALLSPLDDLARLEHSGGDDPDRMREGVKLVHRLFLKTLEDLGVERLQTLGEPFDPREQEAVAHEVRAGIPPGQVLAEVACGYRFQGKLLRPARVVLSAAPQAPPERPPGS